MPGSVQAIPKVNYDDLGFCQVGLTFSSVSTHFVSRYGAMDGTPNMIIAQTKTPTLKVTKGGEMMDPRIPQREMEVGEKPSSWILSLILVYAKKQLQNLIFAVKLLSIPEEIGPQNATFTEVSWPKSPFLQKECDSYVENPCAVLFGRNFEGAAFQKRLLPREGSKDPPIHPKNRIQPDLFRAFLPLPGEVRDSSQKSAFGCPPLSKFKGAPASLNLECGALLADVFFLEPLLSCKKA